MVWAVHDEKWYEMLALAKNYYFEHGNLLVNIKYKTKTGENLGVWIVSQRQAYKFGKLSAGKIMQLERINMVWDLKTNKDDINNYLETLPITIDKKCNKEVLKRMSLIELQTKMQFLNDIGVSPVDELGNLIDIFSMSSYDIEEKYGVRIESLIEYYKNINSRRLCV